MAKLINPLFSRRASGPIKSTQIYGRSRGLNTGRATARRRNSIPLQILRSQAIISQNANVWNTRYKEEVLVSYQEFTAESVALDSFFWTDAVLLDFTYLNMMVIGEST